MSSLNGSGWKPVTASAPCEKCEKPGWCSRSSDGVWLRCMRHNDGTAIEKHDKNGDPYYLYRLVPATNQSPEPRYSLADGGGQSANPETLNKVYTALLAQLSLSGQHVDALLARGAGEDAEAVHTFANQRGYRTLGAGRTVAVSSLIGQGFEPSLPNVPGFVVREHKAKQRRYWSFGRSGGLLVPVRNIERQIVAVVVRLDDADSGHGKYRWLSSKAFGGPGPGAPVHVPLFDGSTETARITEGAMKADIATHLSGMLTLGLPGVNCWRRAAGLLKTLGAKTVRVALDADARRNRHVAQCLRRLVQELPKLGFTVEVELWDEKDGKGIDDLLVAGKQPEILTSGDEIARAVRDIVSAARKADPPKPTKGSASRPDLPIIQANDRQLRDTTDDALAAIQAINDPPQLFQRGRTLSRVVIDSDTDAPSCEVLDPAAVRGVLARSATWVQVSGHAENPKVASVSPPKDVVLDLMSLAAWPMPSLRSIVETPVFSRDGELVAAPGYHPGSRLWHHPCKGLKIEPVPERPTRENVLRALSLLDEVFGDFPFADAASHAHAIAALLLHFVREMVDGCTPFHLFDAPTPGTGKTLLIFAISTIATGREIEAMSEAEKDEEWRKRITAALGEAPPAILIDNLGRILDSPSLASVLTARTWSDRILGYSKRARLPNQAVWLGSGNNTRLSHELIRRTVWCRLDAKTDAPEQRTGFRHPSLITWVKEHRGALVWACLTLCRAWIAADRPKGRQTLGGFEAWAEVMGGILDVIEVPGLLANAKTFRSVSSDRVSELRSFVLSWWQEYGQKVVGVEELFALVTREQLLDRVLGDKGEKSQRIRLGIEMRRMVDQVYGTQEHGKYRVERKEEDHKGRQQYALACLEKGAEQQPVAAAKPEANGVAKECEWSA